MVFVLVGPALGGTATIAVLVLVGSNVTSLHALGVWISSASIHGLWLAYPVGIVPALAIGIFFAAVDYGSQRSNLLGAVAVGLAAGAIWVLVMGGRPGKSAIGNAIVIGVAVGTVACWSLRRRRRRTRRDVAG